ncbi:hypothetical protein H5399_00490 [Tessaracoccus sp. MC1627]|uniref:GH116 family glycosyl-hydrolase n=1 Tax=Tessaracoccus sp. MC1627 TaxID=2760312 RepID=UPI001600A53E|nr:GH116 family glycosyl-hydrolase [Tessaracoccus sp. MC1627]MBB1511090.1 hypothetical protein [Tessaracoccus sp. MC1627]
MFRRHTEARSAPGTSSRSAVARAGGVAALAVALTLAVGAVVPSPHAAASPKDSGFEIPSAATVRPLGEISEGTCPDTFLPYACKEDSPWWPYPGIKFPLTVPGMGIPLGGIGAGSFMVNQSGTFGPWFFGGSQNNSWETRALPQAAFHVREQIGNQPAEVRTLATDGAKALDHNGELIDERSWEDPLSGWNTLDAGDAEYAALYPFGWMTYEPFQTDISMRFYSPIVAEDDRRSSLPVAYFDVQISNDTDETAKVSTMFTMPNVAAHEDRQPVTVREGLSSQYRVDKARGIHAVTLASDSPENTPDAHKSEWTIAAVVDKNQSFSYTTSWDATGDGSDVYAPFTASGALGNGALDDSASAGAISVSATLKPGEVATIPFVLTWDFPQVAFNDNETVWMRRYTNFYGAKTTEKNDYIAGSYPFHQSYSIARDALTDRKKNLADVQKWWSPLVDSTSHPDWLKEAALNQLANVTFHTALWEGGLVSNTEPVITGGDRIGSAVPGTHNYLGLDSNSGGLSTLGQGGEIGIYSYTVYSDLFPSIERDRMRNKVEAIMAETTEGDPWDFGMAENGGDNPFISWRQGTDSGPGLAWFLDRPAINVFRLYDYSQRHNDPGFLRFAYPAMEKTFAFLQKTIPADYALPEVPSANNPSPDLLSPFPMSNAYNGLPSNRFDAYVSSLYILATETMIEAGQRMGEDKATIDALRADLTAAKADFEELFWLADGGYYRYTPAESEGGDEDAMIATFLAQFLAERAGLPDVVDMDRYATHLETVAGFTEGLTDDAGRPVGANLVASATGSSASVTVQANYAFAANLVSAGRRLGDDSLVDSGMGFAGAVAGQLWGVPEWGYEFNTAGSYEAHDPGQFGAYPSWEGNLSVWQLVDVLNRDANGCRLPNGEEHPGGGKSANACKDPASPVK